MYRERYTHTCEYAIYMHICIKYTYVCISLSIYIYIYMFMYVSYIYIYKSMYTLTNIYRCLVEQADVAPHGHRAAQQRAQAPQLGAYLPRGAEVVGPASQVLMSISILMIIMLIVYVSSVL